MEIKIEKEGISQSAKTLLAMVDQGITHGSRIEIQLKEDATLYQKMHGSYPYAQGYCTQKENPMEHPFDRGGYTITARVFNLNADLLLLTHIWPAGETNAEGVFFVTDKAIADYKGDFLNDVVGKYARLSASSFVGGMLDSTLKDDEPISPVPRL